MRGILITTDGKVSIEEYDENPLYESISEAIGGYFETVALRRRPYLLLVNEEGRLLGLPVNTIASMLYGEQIVGNAIVAKVGKRDGERDIVGLSLDDSDVLADLMVLRARARMEGMLP